MYTVTVKPGSSKGPLVEICGVEELKVYLSAKAVDGQANKQLIEVLAKHFNVSKSKVKLIRGEKARIKHVKIM